jgi:hypothetical protein
MVLLRNPRFLALLRVLFWLALIFAVTMAVLPKPPKLPIDSYGDKFAHILAFATLAGLGGLGFGAERRWRLAERLSFTGAMIEVVQAIPALNRDCDIRDWIADTLAVVVVTAVLAWLLPRSGGDATGEG